MSLNNCKVQLKPRWAKHCVQVDVKNDNANSKIIFTIRNTKLHVPAAIISVEDNQKLSKSLNKGFERSVYSNENKTKSENKNMANENRYFLKSNFVGVNRLFVLICLNKNNGVKQFKAQRYYLPKHIIRNYIVIISGKNFFDQPIVPDVKLYKEMRKLTTMLGENYTTTCLQFVNT